MRFSELAFVTKTYGNGKSDLLVIIPFYSEYAYVRKHLDFLSRQTNKGFDAILILGPVADERKVLGLIEGLNMPFTLIVAKRKEDTGSAGGFFTGQKYALENSYKYMVFADIDCLPVDAELLAAIMEKREAHHVRPHVQLTGTDGKVVQVSIEGNIPWYGLLSTDIVRKYGLYYAPLYLGADDLEYIERIRQEPVHVESLCQHPYSFNMAYRNLDKYLLYLLHGLMMTRRPAQFIKYLVVLFFSLPVLLIFSPAYGRKAFLQMMRLLLTHSYGKAAVEGLKSGFSSSIMPQKTDGFLSVDYDSSYTSDKSYSGMPLKAAIAALRKNIAICRCNSGFLATITSIFAKKAVYKTEEGRCLLLADNSNILIHAFKLALFALVFPALAMFLAVTFIPMKIILQPKTLGYGLD